MDYVLSRTARTTSWTIACPNAVWSTIIYSEYASPSLYHTSCTTQCAWPSRRQSINLWLSTISFQSLDCSSLTLKTSTASILWLVSSSQRYRTHSCTLRISLRCLACVTRVFMRSQSWCSSRHILLVAPSYPGLTYIIRLHASLIIGFSNLPALASSSNH